MAKSKAGVDEVKAELLRKRPKPVIRNEDLLSTGSTLLNLCCTGRPAGGFAKGKYYLLVGASKAGKTMLALTCFAEACLNKEFRNYRLVYDNVEDGALMDWERFFGKEVARRVEPPAGTKAKPVYSTTIEEFYHKLYDALAGGKPVIYVLDSMDGLSSVAEGKKFKEGKKAAEKGEKAKGSYGDGKAKKNSEGVRQVIQRLRRTGSILLIIAQERDNIDPFSFEEHTRAGGHALTFYATNEIWVSNRRKLRKRVRGKDRTVGSVTRVDVKKNRVTGREGSCEIPIYRSTGVDDIGSCVDYLVDEGQWKEKEGQVTASDFGVYGTREELVAYVEANGLEASLRSLVHEVWEEIERASEVRRKPRYL